MSKKYHCKCGCEIVHHSDEKLPAPTKCPVCGGTNITLKRSSDSPEPTEEVAVNE
jgi:hypothetical protein